MRHAPPRPARWLRRIVALAGAAALLSLGALASGTAQARPLSRHRAAAPGQQATAAGSAVTVTGPHMWDTSTNSPYATASTVTVSQTADLVNQFVTVSWTGFTPSNANGFPGGYSLYTLYPVQIAECAGTDPASISANCDGLNDSGQEPGSAGPTTEVDGLTGPAASPTQSPTKGGAGTASIQIVTTQQDSDLGCDQDHPCSLVILPIDGGDYLNSDCSDHSGDSSSLWASTDMVLPSNTVCAWQDRIVVPLHFAPGQADCKFSTPDFTVVGSPLMQRAMTSWIGKLCSGSDPAHFVFTGTLNEPDARNDFLSGADTVALTTEPADGPAEGRSYTYAPVGISATVAAYWLDNPTTGVPYTSLSLTPRLMTKLITESYNYAQYGCTAQDVTNPPPNGCDDAVDGNPENMFTDPDFQQYNPGIQPQTSNTAADGADFPTVLSGNSDMTYELTNWIAADSAAVSFLDGTPDPWGMRVNTNYLATKFPEQALNSEDLYPLWAGEYSPQFPLAHVLFYQAGNWDPGVNPFEAQCDPICEPTPNPIEPPGHRDLIAIVDEADAAADDFPTAALQNHAGKFVTATQASMQAAVDNMVTSSNGITKDDNQTTKDPDVYPLTMVVYAMVPTSHTSRTTAQKIAQWLDYVAGAGQDQGTSTGQLPAGYVPLPKSMRDQTLKAAYEVLHQTGTKPSGGYHGPGGKSSGTATGGGSKGSSSGKDHGTTGSKPAIGKVNAAYSSPDTAGLPQWALPLLLVAGGLLALAGTSAVVLSRPGGRAALQRGWRRVSTLGRNP